MNTTKTATPEPEIFSRVVEREFSHFFDDRSIEVGLKELEVAISSMLKNCGLNASIRRYAGNKIALWCDELEDFSWINMPPPDYVEEDDHFFVRWWYFDERYTK